MTILNKVSNKTLMPGITAIPDVPDAPTIGAVTDPGTDGYATIAFTPAVTGGTVTTYTATSTPGSITATSATSPITVTGLTVSTAYTFKVKGANATATGPESAASSSFTPAPHNSFESIQTVTVGSGGQSSISFTSIPSTYKHLQLRMLTQLSGGNGELDLQFNSDTGSNYSYHRIYGNGTSAVAESGVSTTQATVGYYASATSVFNAAIVDILDYSNTNKYKTTRSLNGMDTNGGGLVLFDSSNWRSTSAITSITVFSKDGSRPLAQYSSFALYGIKG